MSGLIFQLELLDAHPCSSGFVWAAWSQAGSMNCSIEATKDLQEPHGWTQSCHLSSLLYREIHTDVWLCKLNSSRGSSCWKSPYPSQAKARSALSLNQSKYTGERLLVPLLSAQCCSCLLLYSTALFQYITPQHHPR